MTENLTGSEASELERIDALLEAVPDSLEGLYYDTIGFDPRAIAVAAGMRAGSGGGGGGSQPLEVATAEITSADILGGMGVGNQVLLTPGVPGKILLPIRGFYVFTPGTIPYTQDPDPSNKEFTVGFGNDIALDFRDWLVSAHIEDNLTRAVPGIGGMEGDPSVRLELDTVEGQDMRVGIRVGGGNFVDGNGAAIMTVCYTILDAS